MVNIFTFVILISTAEFLVMYLFCSLAALKLAIRGDLGIQGKRLRWMLIIAVIAALYSLWTLYGAGWEALWLEPGSIRRWTPGLLRHEMATTPRSADGDGRRQ